METRDKILYESFKLFVERGYGDVSMNDIVTSSGITKGGFYHYFKSKEELFAELLQNYILVPMKEFKDYLRNLSGPPTERLDAFFYSYIYIIDEMVKLLEDEKHVYGYYLMYFSAQQTIKDFDVQLSMIYEDIISVIKDILRGLLAGKHSVDEAVVDHWAVHIVSLCEGICILWILNKKRDYKEMFLEANETVKAALLNL
ncbi:MAG: TetR/AcrR family transcriptional regulator [Bacillota bacterium]|nr:TetR/AcrR family transcriptional regulator [Bacillota bacterium]